ncbi:MAG TPA: hypothetical protein VN698_12995 [Bacteroidia bacterium]|nr:hypothetical protein [Bacteroidia bacterium]
MSRTKALSAMMGKTYQHRTSEEIYKFLSFKETGETILVATDKDWLETTIYNVNVFMREYKEVEVKGNDIVAVANTPEKQMVSRSRIAPNQTLEKIRDVLLDSMDKVVASRDYVPQAQQISKSAQTLINLAKLEIDIHTKL